MPLRQERGIALVIALFLMAALSVVSASLMFLSQTETFASMNYRMMSQSRYAAEGGVNKAANFLLDSTQYATPGTAADPLSNYDRTKSPVVCTSGCTVINAPVVLSADSSVPSNYPVAAVQTAYNAAAQGTLTAGNATLTYKTHATLMAMQQFVAYGGTQSVVQTWSISSDGAFGNGSKATVEVVATIETPKVAANSYAAFATYAGCDAIQFHGNTTVDSYDSSVGPPGNGAGNSTEDSGGDVGTNGNLHIWGSVDVQGNLYTPKTGVGSCTANAVTGLTEGGSANVEGSMVPLPTVVSYPVPSFSATPPTTAVTINSTLMANPTNACTSLGLTLGTNCAYNAGTKTLTVDGAGADVTMPSVSVSGGYTLVFAGHAPPNNININSLTGSGDIQIAANLVTDTGQAVVLKIAGKNSDGTDMATPVDLASMGWKQNSSNATAKYDAAALQIVYAGTGTISMQGNSQSAATIYAPNANFSLQGTADLYGSVLARTVSNGGNASIHYDRRLSRDFWVAGNPMMGTFTWNTSQ
jgi:type IV pilus assembly PilX-like protein